MNNLNLLKSRSVLDFQEDPEFLNYCKCSLFVFELIKSPQFNRYKDIISIHNNKSFYLSIVKNNPECILLLPKNILKDKFFLLHCLESNIEVAKYIPQHFRNKELLNWFIWRYSSSNPLKYLPEKYKDNFNVAKKLVTYDSLNFKDLSERLRNNKNLYVISVNKQNMSSLFIYAGTAIRSDKKLCIKAISQSFKRYQYITEDLKKNMNFFITLLNLNYHFLELAPDNIKSSHKCVYEAVKRNPQSLVYADPILLSDIKFAQKVKKNVSAIDFQQVVRYFTNEVQIILRT